MIDFEAIRKRADAATPGPWEANWLDDCFIEPRICVIPANGCYDYDKFEANSEFIAHAREDIPYLLSQLAERDKELKRLQKEVASLAIESVKRDIGLAKLEAEVMAAMAAKQGEWIEKFPTDDSMTCSVCGAIFNYYDNCTGRFNFCPSCGAAGVVLKGGTA